MPQPWWQRAVFYQIYVRSFADSDGDGVGDIPGILDKLDYLNDGTPASLGVDALWLTPIYPSPDFDFGYDVADYTAVNPRFGSLADFDLLLEKAHARGMKIILDFVPNHTSHLHPWFAAARSSRSDPRHDWYIWADRKPNNWQSAFGGSAWQYEPAVGRYYLHSFLREQPDLNWRHPEVKEAIFAAMRFWLERGVDGFRLDVINHIFKDAGMRSNPPRLGSRPYDMQRHLYDRNRPEVHEVLRDLRKLLEAYGERMAVGEVNREDFRDAGEPAAYCGRDGDELHLAFDFAFPACPWDAGRFARAIAAWEEALPPGAWPCYVLSNHDLPRHISRYARAGRTVARAKLAAMMLLTLRGTPFLYYGEEIGLQSGRIPRRQIVDPVGRRYWPLYPGRDIARTPMPWHGGPGAGFTTGQPWLPLNKDYARTNVAAQTGDPQSLLSLYRRLIWLRKREPVLQAGAYQQLPGPRDCLVYRRELAGEEIVVALNFGSRRRRVDLPAGGGRVLLATGGREGSITGGDMVLGPEEGVIIKLENEEIPV